MKTNKVVWVADDCVLSFYELKERLMQTGLLKEDPAIKFLSDGLREEYGPDVIVAGPMTIDHGPHDRFVVLNNNIIVLNDNERVIDVAPYGPDVIVAGPMTLDYPDQHGSFILIDDKIVVVDENKIDRMVEYVDFHIMRFDRWQPTCQN